MGRTAATTLMEYLPANGWREVATVSDIDNLRTELRSEMTELRSELRGEIAGLRGEMQAMGDKIRADVMLEISRMTRTIIVAFVTGLIAFGGLLVAAAAIFKP